MSALSSPSTATIVVVCRRIIAMIATIWCSRGDRVLVRDTLLVAARRGRGFQESGGNAGVANLLKTGCVGDEPLDNRMQE